MKVYLDLTASKGGFLLCRWFVDTSVIPLAEKEALQLSEIPVISDSDSLITTEGFM